MLLEDLWKAQDQFRKRQDACNLHSVIDLSLKHFGRSELVQLNNHAKIDRSLLPQLRPKIENLKTSSAVDTMLKREIVQMIDAFFRSRGSK
jgi:hypothetical protein